MFEDEKRRPRPKRRQFLDGFFQLLGGTKPMLVQPHIAGYIFVTARALDEMPER
jgi:hypothetical protein